MEWDALVDMLAAALADALRTYVQEKRQSPPSLARVLPDRLSPGRPSGRKLVAARDVERLSPGSSLRLSSRAIITPLAQEIVRDNGIIIIWEEGCGENRDDCGQRMGHQKR